MRLSIVLVLVVVLVLESVAALAVSPYRLSTALIMQSAGTGSSARSQQCCCYAYWTQSVGMSSRSSELHTALITIVTGSILGLALIDWAKISVTAEFLGQQKS